MADAAPNLSLRARCAATGLYLSVEQARGCVGAGWYGQGGAQPQALTPEAQDYYRIRPLSVSRAVRVGVLRVRRTRRDPAPGRREGRARGGDREQGGIVCQIPGQAAALRQIPSNCRQIPDPARAPTIPLWLQRSERLLTNLLLPLSGGIISAILFPW